MWSERVLRIGYPLAENWLLRVLKEKGGAESHGRSVWQMICESSGCERKMHRIVCYGRCAFGGKRLTHAGMENRRKTISSSSSIDGEPDVKLKHSKPKILKKNTSIR